MIDNSQLNLNTTSWIVETPIGKIEAQPASDHNYPGIYVSVNGTQLVLIEYDSIHEQHAVRVWNHNDPDIDPEYTQTIPKLVWIKTDDFQFVRKDSDTCFTVIDISVLDEDDYFLRYVHVDIEALSIDEILSTIQTYGWDFTNGKLVVIGTTTPACNADIQNQLIAECIAEQTLPIDADDTARFNSLRELNTYLISHGIQQPIE
ncbi:hypothetical protein [Paenibacillus terrae]|uniref:Uncharacterized protein n=1 Tax=Paenibacillus terrae TaxID=159743 RepID=A0A0D7WYE6_9BACL|nr:hypothetical protein [Paenibacillus terrae]KJD43999.1 hypothetical protein QD47_19530 [Paenibacillus terrae]